MNDRPTDWLAFFAGPSLAPYVKHDCAVPGSNQVLWWEVGDGVEPRPSCGCKYPQSPDFRAHLSALPKRDEEEPLPVLIEAARHQKKK